MDVINGDFTSRRDTTNSEYTKIYMDFADKIVFEDCKKFNNTAKSMGIIKTMLEKEERNSLLIIIDNIIAERYEQSLIEYITFSISAKNKAIEAAIQAYNNELREFTKKRIEKIIDDMG